VIGSADGDVNDIPKHFNLQSSLTHPRLSPRAREVNWNNRDTMLARQAPTTQALSSLSHRVLPSAAATTRLSVISTQSKSQQNRSLATVQDPPKRVYGGLRDQDRIFTNLYSHHGADLKSAMKYGDWYKTKEMLDKGHDWVCLDFQLVCFLV
jgi:hypothetical protein